MVRKANLKKRRVVIVLKGGGNSGKTGSLRRLYHQLCKMGAKLEGKDKEKSKNLRQYKLLYKRWRVVICEGGDSDSVIRDNFAFADRALFAKNKNNKDKSRQKSYDWDVVIMPAWQNIYTKDNEYLQGCVGALLEEVWKHSYSLEIVDRNPVAGRKSDEDKFRNQTECAKRLKQCIDFVISDRFPIKQ